MHRNLIDHLNAEIGLGTITSASSAKKWLSSTFLYVRLKENPEHYKLDGDPTARNLDERLENICTKGIAALESHELVSKVPNLHCTENGDAMARYYLQFDTMKVLLALPPKAKVSQILSAISQAAELKDVRFRAGEKPVYKDLNKNPSIKFPLPGTLDLPAQKISLVIQSVLGGIDLPSEDYKVRQDYMVSKAVIFNNINRLIRCVIDCQLYVEDAVTARNALALARSLGAQVWDDSPLHIKQLDGLGPASVRKLVGAGIKSIEDLENTEPHRIEQALSRNPPFGTQVLDRARSFPKLRVSLQMIGEPRIKKGEHVSIKLKAEIGFLNDEIPQMFQRKPVYVCLLAETDGRVVHFARTGAKRLDKGQDVLFSAHLATNTQSIRAYVMCDEIAGTLRHASLKPDIPANAFPPPKTAEDMNKQRTLVSHEPNSSKRRTSGNTSNGGKDDESDEFGLGGIDDADFAQAEADAFIDIDDINGTANPSESPRKKQKTSASTQVSADWQPTQLSNGKWACKHVCKDKTQCKHMCCREGSDNKPKPPKPAQEKKQAEPQSDPRQTQVSASLTKKSSAPTSTAVAKSIQKAPATQARKKTDARGVRDLDKLHNSMKTKTPKVPILGHGAASKGAEKGQTSLSFLPSNSNDRDSADTTDYGGGSLDSNYLPDMGEIFDTQKPSRMSPPRDAEDEEMLDTGYGLDEGDELSQPFGQGNGDGNVDFSSYPDADAPQNQPDDKEDTGRITVAKDTTKGKESHLFIGYSTDSAANDLGVSQEQTRKRAAAEKVAASKTSKSFEASQKRPPRTPSAQLREQEESFMAALPPDEFITAVDDDLRAAREQKEDSPDDLKKWVVEEFGTEQFNFTW